MKRLCANMPSYSLMKNLYFLANGPNHFICAQLLSEAEWVVNCIALAGVCTVNGAFIHTIG